MDGLGRSLSSICQWLEVYTAKEEEIHAVLHRHFNPPDWLLVTHDGKIELTDTVNTLLNYGYAFLESICRATIDTVGLEPSIGFLHEIAQPKHPLVYDLQEPFRGIVHITVLSSVENKTFTKNDFFLTDNYILRLMTSAIRKLLEQLRLRFQDLLPRRISRRNPSIRPRPLPLGTLPCHDGTGRDHRSHSR